MNNEKKKNEFIVTNSSISRTSKRYFLFIIFAILLAMIIEIADAILNPPSGSRGGMIVMAVVLFGFPISIIVFAFVETYKQRRKMIVEDGGIRLFERQWFCYKREVSFFSKDLISSVELYYFDRIGVAGVKMYRGLNYFLDINSGKEAVSLNFFPKDLPRLVEVLKEKQYSFFGPTRKEGELITKLVETIQKKIN